MAKRTDLFIRLSLDYANHPKIASLSDAAFRAHVEMILYSRKYETDGILKNRVVNRVGSGWDAEVVAELLTNDDAAPSLLQLDNGDYELHGFSDMQETKAEIAARRAINAQNGKRGGRPRKPKKTQPVSESLSGSPPGSGTETKAETETETETEVNPSATVASDDARSSQTLVGEWIDNCAERPPGRVIGQLSKEIKTLLDEGQDYQQVRSAVQTWNTKGAHPSVLPSVLHELRNKRAQPPRQTAAEREMQIAKERHERIGNGQLGKPLSWDQVFQPKQIEDAQ
ncbi:hypothetical protein [Nesterenkonia jeotgali]|uniref:Uncharacterized protein n=1 Tax=Nesterenkonia jeotgali TaxID=317018 RepID=A0A0W8IGU6_9MICC|nr:hypothetical protein [Nesterenkonia jeotgali]KUG58960.1 hypothetical protein AVL63_02755 [Nesterenkonia jeotgali]